MELKGSRTGSHKETFDNSYHNHDSFHFFHRHCKESDYDANLRLQPELFEETSKVVIIVPPFYNQPF